MGGEFTMLIDRGCGLRDEVDRCDEKTVCEGFLDWIYAKLGLPIEELTPKQLNGLGKLHATLVSIYKLETQRMGSFLRHEDSEKEWRDVIYNHIDLYDMLFTWGLRSIEYPQSLSVVPAESSILG